jgi:hypothetical protein
MDPRLRGGEELGRCLSGNTLRMAIDLGQLFAGRLVYDAPVAALDDVRFERIVRGFGQHYEVTSQSASKFYFERGEGYINIGRFDAFGFVDHGSVERLRELPPEIEGVGGNVILMPKRYAGLRFMLHIRVIMTLWAFVMLSGWIFIRGDWMWWLIGFIAVVTGTIVLIQRSLRRKLADWLARESWN